MRSTYQYREVRKRELLQGLFIPSPLSWLIILGGRVSVLRTVVYLLIAGLGLLGACNSEIYLRDGVTDGDTFYLARRALQDDNPVLQSWVAYSLSRSACQLESGGTNPARANSFRCEFRARRMLAETWMEKVEAYPALSDAYLDDLLRVHQANHLEAYVLHFFGKQNWQSPQYIDREVFRKWRYKNLRRHKAETRIIGSWGYAHPPVIG